MTQFNYLLKLILVAVTVSTATVSAGVMYNVSQASIVTADNRTILGHRIDAAGQEIVVYAR